MTESIKNFWTYFKRWNYVLRTGVKIPAGQKEKILEGLAAMLAGYCKDLGYAVADAAGQSVLTITAYGNPYLFKEVELLVHFAPMVYNWKVVAFLQPCADLEIFKLGKDEAFELFGISLKISEMYFLPVEDEDRPAHLGIRIFLNCYMTERDNIRLQEAVYAIVENLIGEKSFAGDVAFISLAQATPEILGAGAIELYNLAAYIATWKKAFPLL